MKSPNGVKNLRKKWFTAILLLLSLYGTAQRSSKVGEFDVFFLPSQKGGVMLFSGKKHSLTIEITADSVQPTDQANFVLVNNQIFQVSLVPLPDRSDASVIPLARQKEILSGYVGYEMDYFQKQLNLDVRNLQREWIIIDGKGFLIWYFDLLQHSTDKTDDPAKPILKQVYLSVLWNDQVLDLNNVLSDAKKVPESRTFLLQTAGLVKTYEGRVDITSLSKKRG